VRCDGEQRGEGRAGAPPRGRVGRRAGRRHAAPRRGRAAAGADRRDRTAHRGAEGRTRAARLCRRRWHPDCTCRPRNLARGQPRRYALETKVKGPDSSERGELRVPDLRTELPGPKARDIIARDRAAVATSYPPDYP